MSDNGLITGIALGLSTAAFGIGLVVLLRLIWQPPQYQAQPLQYQPQREETLVKLTEEVTPVGKKKIIGYVTSEE